MLSSMQMEDSEWHMLCDVHESTAQISQLLNEVCIPQHMNVLQSMVRHEDMIAWLQDMKSKILGYMTHS